MKVNIFNIRPNKYNVKIKDESPLPPSTDNLSNCDGMIMNCKSCHLNNKAFSILNFNHMLINLLSIFIIFYE